MTFSSIISIETPVLEKAGKPCLFHEAESVECRKRDGRSGEDKLEMLCDLHREEDGLNDGPYKLVSRLSASRLGGEFFFGLVDRVVDLKFLWVLVDGSALVVWILVSCWVTWRLL